MGVLDEYLVDPRLSLLDKTRIQAQVLVPVLKAVRSELGKEKADSIVTQALRDWSKQLFAVVGDSVDGGRRRKWAVIAARVSRLTVFAVSTLVEAPLIGRSSPDGAAPVPA
jgi:hypothetical protein